MSENDVFVIYKRHYPLNPYIIHLGEVSDAEAMERAKTAAPESDWVTYDIIRNGESVL